MPLQFGFSYNFPFQCGGSSKYFKLNNLHIFIQNIEDAKNLDNCKTNKIMYELFLLTEG